MPSSWLNIRKLTPKFTATDFRRAAVLGVGNELNGDDGVGVVIARRLKKHWADHANLLSIEAGLAPENYTGLLRKFNPSDIILVDAAIMELQPGEPGWLDWTQADGMSASTHSLPLSMVGRYLKDELGCQVWLLGIQPAQLETGEGLSKPVRRAVKHAIIYLNEILISLDSSK